MKPKTVGRGYGTGHDAQSTGTQTALKAETERQLLTGICANALVVTMNGVRKVEDLRPGDVLVTRSNGAVPLRRVKQKNMVTRCVYVIAGSLGHYKSDRDTLLPAAQTVLVRDWRAQFLGGSASMLTAARTLVDGEYVRDIGYMPLTVYQLTCDIETVLYADGMELGTADAVGHSRLDTCPS